MNYDDFLKSTVEFYSTERVLPIGKQNILVAIGDKIVDLKGDVWQVLEYDINSEQMTIMDHKASLRYISCAEYLYEFDQIPNEAPIDRKCECGADKIKWMAGHHSTGCPKNKESK